MPAKYHLGIDQGTTGTACLLLDEGFQVKGRGYCEVRQYYPQPGWVEQDALELFFSILEAVRQAMAQGEAQPGDIASIGLDNQGETVVAWDSATGLPLYRAIVWQDKRTSALAEKLKEAHGSLIQEKTGLRVDSYFSATKIHWLLNDVPQVRQALGRGTLMVGTTDSWFLWKLTGEYLTDLSTASRTMLLNLHTGAWDGEILALLEIPERILPRICDCDAIHCITKSEMFFGARVPVGGSMVDQQAALLGQGCVRAGDVKTTYGTGCFMLMNTGTTPVQSRRGLLTTLAWQAGGARSYALDGGIYVAGTAVQWLKNGLKLIESAQESSSLAYSIPDNGGVYFVPACSGVVAPYWDEYARGTIVGLTAAATPAHIVRAALESIAYQVWDNLEVMREEARSDISAMRVDGGLVNSEFLMQFQADILGIPVEVPEISECTALGAAYMGALGTGRLESLELCKSYWRGKTVYVPRMEADRREGLLHQWHRAVERSRGWLERE